MSQKGHAPPSLLPTLNTEAIVPTANSTVSSTTSSTIQECTDSIPPVTTTTLHSTSPTTAFNIEDQNTRGSVSPSLPIGIHDEQMSSSIAKNAAVGQVLGSLENFPETVVSSHIDDKGVESCSIDKGSVCSVCISEKDVLHLKRGLKEYPRGPSPQYDSKK